MCERSAKPSTRSPLLRAERLTSVCLITPAAWERRSAILVPAPPEEWLARVTRPCYNAAR